MPINALFFLSFFLSFFLTPRVKFYILKKKISYQYDTINGMHQHNLFQFYCDIKPLWTQNPEKLNIVHKYHIITNFTEELKHFLFKTPIVRLVHFSLSLSKAWSLLDLEQSSCLNSHYHWDSQSKQCFNSFTDTKARLMSFHGGPIIFWDYCVYCLFKWIVGQIHFWK